MNDLMVDLFRGSVSSVMNVILLFTLARSRFDRKINIMVAAFVFALNILSTIWFYLYGDLTGLSRFNLVIFLIVGLALKPLTKLNFMQWCFTFLTIINISMMIIVSSFHLSRLLPMPQYSNTILRFILYVIVIYISQRHLLPLYRSIVKNWQIFSALVICIFLNLGYFFYATDDIQNTLTINKWPLLLLVALSLVAYGTVFYSMKRFIAITELECENLKIQDESGRLYKETMKLEKYANYDTLTGLPNRRFFFERLKKMVEESERISCQSAILYIDLDAFKDVNDTYGHEVGDSVLITVGNTLLKCIQKTDFAARLGGDEFAVLIHDIEDVPAVEHLAKKIHKALQENMSIDTVECKINSSIGIAVYPEDGKDSETLIRHADSAMYAIKKNGKGGGEKINGLQD